MNGSDEAKEYPGRGSMGEKEEQRLTYDSKPLMTQKKKERGSEGKVKSPSPPQRKIEIRTLENENHEVEKKTTPQEKNIPATKARNETKNEKGLSDQVDPKGEDKQLSLNDETNKFFSPLSNDINYNFYHDSLSLDHTKPITEALSHLYKFQPSKEIKANIEKLKEKRVALLVCINNEVLNSMAHTIINEPEFEEYEKRMLTFDGKNAERDDLYLNTLIGDTVGRCQKVLIVVELEGQMGFFDSLFSKSLSFLSTKEILKEKDIMLICMVQSSIFQKVPLQKQSKFLFHRWDIDFLPYLLELSSMGKTDLNPLQSDILAQRNYGLWGRKGDDHEFHQLIVGYIRQGWQTFEKEIDKRREFITTRRPTEEFLDNINKVKATELFIDKEPYKTVLYTAAYYSELTPNDFEQVVLLLLKGKKTYIEKESKIITENGELKIIKTEEEKELVDVWDKNADRILRECQLRVLGVDNLNQFIDFKSPYLRKDIQRYIEEEYPYYFRHQFEPIRHLDITFLSDLSPRILKNVVRLSVKMALMDPDYYGVDSLVNLVIQFNNHLKKGDYSTPDVVTNENMQFIVNHEKINIKKQFYVLLSNLIREMLNHSHLQETINNFFRRLMEKRYYREILEVLLEFGKRLRFAPHFNLLYWLKRLLDQGYEEIRDGAYKLLLEFAGESKLLIYELMEGIGMWVPKKDKEVRTYSFSNQYALLFAYDYCLKTAYDFKQEFWGEWPSKYPLFFSMHKDKGLIERRLEYFLNWLLHPGNQMVLDMKFPEKNFSTSCSLAYLVEIWALILLGRNIGEAHPEALMVFDILLEKLFHKSDLRKKREIIMFWRLKSKDYRHQIYLTSITEKKQRDELMCRYQTLTTLVNRFEKYMKLITKEENIGTEKFSE